MKELKFKPFIGENDKPIKASPCIFTFTEWFLETFSYYEYESKNEDTELLDYTYVDSRTVYLKHSIELSYYWSNTIKAYFLDINGDCWGFAERSDGEKIYNEIKSWLSKY